MRRLPAPLLAGSMIVPLFLAGCGTVGRVSTPTQVNALPHLNTYMTAGPQGQADGNAIVASDRIGQTVWVAMGSTSKPQIYVYRTVNAGKTWSRSTVGALHNDFPYSVRLAVAGRHDVWLLAAGAPAAGQENWYLYRSTDGGVHWDALPQPVAHFVSGDVSGLNMKFTSPEMGWLTFYAPIIISGTVIGVFRTLDGGQTWMGASIQFKPHWTRVLINGPVVSAPDEWTLTLRDGDPGSNESRAYVSHDQGATWHRIGAGTPE